MYKPNQTLWLINRKEYATFIKQSKESSIPIAIIECNGKKEHISYKELHSTAHDMLTELGFEKVTENKRIIKYRNGLHYIEFEIENIRYAYESCDENNNVYYAQWVDKPLHEAITQMLIELEANNV